MLPARTGEPHRRGRAAPSSAPSTLPARRGGWPEDCGAVVKMGRERTALCQGRWRERARSPGRPAVREGGVGAVSMGAERCAGAGAEGWGRGAAHRARRARPSDAVVVEERRPSPTSRRGRATTPLTPAAAHARSTRPAESGRRPSWSSGDRRPQSSGRTAAAGHESVLGTLEAFFTGTNGTGTCDRAARRQGGR